MEQNKFYRKQPAKGKNVRIKKKNNPVRDRIIDIEPGVITLTNQNLVTPERKLHRRKLMNEIPHERMTSGVIKLSKKELYHEKSKKKIPTLKPAEENIKISRSNRYVNLKEKVYGSKQDTIDIFKNKILKVPCMKSNNTIIHERTKASINAKRILKSVLDDKVLASKNLFCHKILENSAKSSISDKTRNTVIQTDESLSNLLETQNKEAKTLDKTLTVLAKPQLVDVDSSVIKKEPQNETWEINKELEIEIKQEPFEYMFDQSTIYSIIKKDSDS